MNNKKRFKFLNIDISQTEAQKLHLCIKKRTVIFILLNNIEKQLMRKFGSAYCASAVYRDMCSRCIVERENKPYKKGYDLIFKNRFKQMIEQYRKGRIHSPHNFTIKEFNVLARIMLNTPEC